MRIVFMGSAPLSCGCLEALLPRPDSGTPGHELVGVVTQPDRPKGRNRRVTPGVVRALATERGLPVLSPANVNAPESVAELAALRPDLVVIVAYGQLLRRAILDLPQEGCLNIHASLLPRYRGAAPIQWAIANGDEVTGVTAMFINDRMDAGDMLGTREVPIMTEDTSTTLSARLAMAGAVLLAETVDAIVGGTAVRTEQDETEVTYAAKLKKEDGRIDWTLPADDLYNRIRAFNPWPGCYCHIAGRTLKVLGSRKEAGAGRPGSVLEKGADGPLVATGEGALRLVEVKPEGKRAMDGGAFLCGHPLKEGDLLE